MIESGHTKADLPDDVRLQLDAAWEAWCKAKAAEPFRVNDVLDTYIVYSRLMREYVDASWT